MRASFFVCASILAALPSALAFPKFDAESMKRAADAVAATDAADHGGKGGGDHGGDHGDHGQKGRIIKFPPPPKSTGLKKIPDAAHPFKAPGKNDMRGPCPALNTLANHGYLPRDGIATPEEIVMAVTEGFNMHFEFAQFLVSFATLGRGNANTGQLSIGGPSPRIPALPGGIDGKVAGGIATHGRFEGDVSLSRADAAIGDGVNFQNAIFKGLLDLVAIYGDDGPDGPKTIVNEKSFGEYKDQSFKEDQKKDPKLEYHIGRQFSAFGEVGFIMNMFANGTDGKLSVRMLNSIFMNQTFGNLNWFRRSSPADFKAITDVAGRVRAFHPPAPGANGAHGKYIEDKPMFTDFFCDAYHDIAGNSLAHTLNNVDGILKKNVATLVAAMYKPFKDNVPGCQKVLPRGPAGV